MRILFFYPENPLLKTQGNNARALALLEYFKSRHFKVDLVGQEQHKESLYSINDIEKLKSQALINNGLLLKRGKRKGLKYFIYSIFQSIKGQKGDFNRIRMGQKQEFLSFIANNTYDYVIVSYIYNTALIENVDFGNAKIIVDTHDFLTAQFQNNKSFDLGRYFSTEIDLLGKFDSVWAISSEEKYLYSQFVKNEVVLIPHGLEKKQSSTNKIIDILYVASENSHNVNGAKWFFNNVYPKLDNKIKITVIGKVTKAVEDYVNVEKIDFVEDLEGFYSKTKVVICPMLSGTGLKIKVVEALSYSIPVVCNDRGVDGLINKVNNGCLVTNKAEDFSNYITNLLQNETYYKNKSNEAQAFFDQALSSVKVYEMLDAFFYKN